MADATSKSASIAIKVNIANVKTDIKKVLDYFSNLQRNLNGHLSQLNPTTVQDTAQAAAKKAMLSARIRIQGASKDIIDGFYSTVAKNKGSSVIRLSHSYFSRSLKQPTYQRGIRPEFKITGQQIYRILDTGRKQYQIVKAGNQSKRSSPLRFYWSKISQWITYHWKGPKGGRNRFIIVKQKSNKVDFSTGSRFTEAAEQSVIAMADRIFTRMYETMSKADVKTT